MGKYIRMIDGVPTDEVESGGSVVYAMADKTADGRPQYLMADELIEKVVDKTITDAVTILKAVGVKPIEIEKVIKE